MNNVVNQVAYLQTSRHFSKEIDELTFTLNKSYIDIANAVNSRTIGIFPTNRPAVTGESWFINGNQRQQTLRQVYRFTAAGNIAHGIDPNSIAQFTKCTGSYTDGTNFYGAIYSSNVAIAGQVTFYLTTTNIVVQLGAGAPAITSGTIVLEWLSLI